MAERSSYGRGARILSIGIATTGVVTFAYFAVASHVLDEVDYKGISLLWSLMFIIVSVIYRPIEQLLSRSIAERRALGHAEHSLRVPLIIQGCFALAFLAVALPLQSYLTDDVFDGSATLYWVLVGGVLAYAASYFARGWLAGQPAVRALRRARADGVAVALPVPARGRARDRRRARTSSRSASSPRRSCRSSSCRGRCAAGRAPRPAPADAGARCARAAASRSRSSR